MNINCLETFDAKNIPIDTSFEPKTKKTVAYIVGAVVIKDNKVLMIQEAKPSCKGSWYLPAGRLEPNETFQEGVKREVLEEAGYEFNPDTVICVDSNCNKFWRVTFTGDVSGEIKTEADSESLKAEWLDIDVVMNGGSQDYPLRGLDIIRLLEIGRNFHKASIGSPSTSLPPFCLIPVESDQIHAIYLRPVFVSGDLAGKKGCVLVHTKTSSLPILPTHPRKNYFTNIYGFAETLFKKEDLRSYFQEPGLSMIDITFNARGSLNGLLITLLIQNNSRTDGHKLRTKEYQWLNLSDVLSSQINCSHQLCARFFHSEHPKLI